MSDVKDIPVMRMRKNDTGDGLADCLEKASVNGVDARGRTASQILADALSSPASSIDKQELFEPGSDLYVGATFGQLFGAPLAIAAGLTIVGAGVIAPPVAMAAFAAALFGHDEILSDRQVKIYIINGCDHPVTVSDAYMSCGEESAACANGSLASDGKTFVVAGRRQVPAAGEVTLAGKKVKVCGAGLFGYQKHTTMGVSFYGTAGALAFDSPSFAGKTLGLAFSNGFAKNDICLAGSDDMSLYSSKTPKGSPVTQTFYDEEIGKAKPATAMVYIYQPNTSNLVMTASFSPLNPKDTASVDVVITFYPAWT